MKKYFDTQQELDEYFYRACGQRQVPYKICKNSTVSVFRDIHITKTHNVENVFADNTLPIKFGSVRNFAISENLSINASIHHKNDSLHNTLGFPTIGHNVSLFNIKNLYTVNIEHQHEYDMLMLKGCVQTKNVKNINAITLEFIACDSLRSVHINKANTCFKVKHCPMMGSLNETIKYDEDCELDTFVIEYCNLPSLQGLPKKCQHIAITDLQITDLYGLDDPTVKADIISLLLPNIDKNLTLLFDKNKNICWGSQKPMNSSVLYITLKHLNKLNYKQCVMDFVVDMIDNGYESCL